MKRYLLLYAVCATALLVYGYRRHRSETERLTQNQTALRSEVEHYRNRLGEATASAQVLRLRCSEFEALRAVDAERIRRLGIRLRRLEAAATTVAATEVEFQAPLAHPARAAGDVVSLPSVHPDTVHPSFGRSPALPAPRLYTGGGSGLSDRVRRFRWRDAWVAVEGTVCADSVTCRVRSIDTLRQIVYRVPRRFLFFRWGTKAVRQEISSSNPHTRIVWTEYVKFEKRR